MSLRRWLGQLLVYAVLEIGALCGVPMSPDQIEQIMKLSNTQIVQTVRKESADDDP